MREREALNKTAAPPQILQAVKSAERLGRPRYGASGGTWSVSAAKVAARPDVAEIRRLVAKHGYIAAHLIKADQRAPAVSTFLNRFGSLPQAYERAGLPPRSQSQIVRSGMKRWKKRTASIASARG